MAGLAKTVFKSRALRTPLTLAFNGDSQPIAGAISQLLFRSSYMRHSPAVNIDCQGEGSVTGRGNQKQHPTRGEGFQNTWNAMGQWVTGRSNQNNIPRVGSISEKLRRTFSVYSFNVWC